MSLTTSKLPRKQRKAQNNAPAHANRKLMASHLGNDLLLKYNRRSITVVLGDSVKLLRGSHKGHTGKVAEIRTSSRKIIIEGVTNVKADGTKVPRPVDPSNCVIVKLNMADPRRRDKLASGVTGTAAEKKAALAEMEKAGKEDAKALEAARKQADEEREKARIEREAAEAAEEEEA